MHLALPRGLPWFIVAVGLTAFVVTRAFHPIRHRWSPDVAGILYNADLLNDGGLPYRDTSDMKPPGTFYVVAAIFNLFGRDQSALSIGYAMWMALGAPALFLGAREIYAERRALSGAIASSLYLTQIGIFDMNYASWMTPAFAWSFSLGLIGLHRGSRGTLVGSGLAAAWALLLKQHASVVGIFLLAMGWWGGRRGWSGARPRMLGWWMLGAVIGVLPLVLHYGSEGALEDLARGVLPVGVAADYTRSVALSSTLPYALWRVPMQHLRAFYLPVSIAAAGVLGAWLKHRHGDSSSSFAPGGLLLAASVIGCGLGGLRFFVHYLPQCLPAWALLAAHPAAGDWFEARRKVGSGFVRTAAWAHVFVCAGLAVLIVVLIPLGKHSYFDSYSSRAVERVGEFIRNRSRPDDPILVWGWQGWGVYYFADRRSPSPVFKAMGEVTDFNDNSAFGDASEMHFRDGPLAERLLADVRVRPPRYFVRSVPFFPRLKQDPLDEWPEMQTILTNEYQVVMRDEFLVVYERSAPPERATSR